MNSLLIVVVAFVTATCADLGNNYVVPAEINNELQDTYILPATKTQSAYVALPVSVVNNYIPSGNLQFPASIAALLGQSTQKTIQNTVQRIMQRTVYSSVLPQPAELSTNLYLPPENGPKTTHALLPELLDEPPKVAQQIITTSTAPGTVQNFGISSVAVQGLQENNIASSSQSQLTPKVTGLQLPAIIPQATTVQKTVNIIADPIKVLPITGISSKPVNNVISPLPTQKVTEVKLPAIIPQATTVQKTVNIIAEPIKVLPITGISSKPVNNVISPLPTQKVTEVKLPAIIPQATTVQKTVNIIAEPIKVLPITGISSKSVNNVISPLPTQKVTEVKLPAIIPQPTTVQKTVNIIAEPIKVLPITGISLKPTAAIAEVNTVKNVISLAPTPKVTELKLPAVIPQPTTVQKTVNIIAEPIKVLPITEISSKPIAAIAEVNNVISLAPITRVTAVKLTAITPQPPTVQKTVNIIAEPIKVLPITGISSTPNTKPSAENTVNTAIPTASVQVSQSTASTLNIKPLSEIPVPNINVRFSDIVHNSIPPETNPPAPVKVSQTKATEVQISTPTTSKPVEVSPPSTSPPATLKSPPSLWHLPKVIDIVQKTIKSSVNSNLTPIKVEEELDINKIRQGSPNGPENQYLPPEQKKVYENVEVFTSEGYKTERRLKTTS